MTLRRPTWPAWQVTDPQMLTLYGVGREFQNELVRAILQTIAQAKTIRNPSEENDDD